MALLKVFHKTVSKKKSALYNEAKKDGVYKSIDNFCKNLKISPEELLKTAFKIPRFSKSDIQKLTNKLEMEAKANKLHKAGRRTKSNEELTTDGRTSSQQFSTPQHRPSGTYPIHHLVSELLSKDQVGSIIYKLTQIIHILKIN